MTSAPFRNQLFSPLLQQRVEPSTLDMHALAGPPNFQCEGSKLIYASLPTGLSGQLQHAQATPQSREGVADLVRQNVEPIEMGFYNRETKQFRSLSEVRTHIKLGFVPAALADKPHKSAEIHSQQPYFTLESDLKHVCLTRSDAGVCGILPSNLSICLPSEECHGRGPQQGDHSRHHGHRKRANTNQDRCPVAQVSPVRCERTDIDSHTPSLLEPILP